MIKGRTLNVAFSVVARENHGLFYCLTFANNVKLLGYDACIKELPLVE